MNDSDEVLKMLSDNPQGFFVRYSRDRIARGRRWFFVPSKESKKSLTVDSTICEELRDSEVIKPVIADMEYQIQHALGVQPYRVFVRSSDERK